MRNSSLIERPGIENFRALSLTPKLRMCPVRRARGRGAFQYHGSYAVRHGEGAGKENVGMSNDKTDAKSVRRKPKGFCSTLIGTELVGS